MAPFAPVDTSSGHPVRSHSAQQSLRRLLSARNDGFERVIVPKANVPKRAPGGIEVIGVEKLSDAIAAV